jgi:hypothetical protein
LAVEGFAMRPLWFSFLIAALSAAATVTSFTGIGHAAPGDARMIHGTVEWPATLDREPFVVVRGDDGKLYHVDVTAAQRRGHVGAGARVIVAVVEGGRPYQLAGVTLIPADDAAATAATTVAAPAEPPASESAPVETARPAQPKRAPAVESRPVAPERTPIAEPRPAAPKRTPAGEARLAAPERRPAAEPRPVAPERTPIAEPRPAAPKRAPAGEARLAAPERRPAAEPRPAGPERTPIAAPRPPAAPKLTPAVEAVPATPAAPVIGPATEPHPTIASSAGSVVTTSAPDVAATIARALSGIAGDTAASALTDGIPASPISPSSAVRGAVATDEPPVAVPAPENRPVAVAPSPSTVAASSSPVAAWASAIVASPSAAAASPSPIVASPSAAAASPSPIAASPSAAVAPPSAIAPSPSTDSADTAAPPVAASVAPARPAPAIAMTSLLAQSHWRMDGTVEAIDDMNVIVKTPNGKLWRIDVSTLSWLTRFRWRPGDRITLFGEPRADLRLVANGSLQYEVQPAGTPPR